MMAFYIEVWGVFLGFARPCLGGWLLIRGSRAPVWTWGYEDAMEELYA